MIRWFAAVGTSDREATAVDTALLGRLVPGDHVCWLVEDEEARADGTAAFVRAGLASHHKILYCGDDPDRVVAALEARGVHTGPAMASGQLRVTTAEAAYLAGGVFDAEATLEIWRRQAAQARAEGYLAMRGFGDMSWAGRPVPGADRLPWYEAEINRVFSDGFVLGVCLYDKSLFDPPYLGDLVSAHPGLLSAGAGPAPLLHAARTTGPLGLRLVGEADLSNRRALHAVVQHLVEDATVAGEPVTIDVSELRFADGPAARTLLGAAGSAGGLRLVGCSPALIRVLTFHGAASTPGVSLG
jgi:hypothetical protein